MKVLEGWVRDHQATVYRAAYLILRDRDAAEDAAQDTFLRAWRAADRVSDEAGVRPWLYRIAVNSALNQIRKRKRERTAVARLDRDDVVADPTEASDTAEAVRVAIGALPDKLRVTLICRYFLAMSEQETAATLRIRPGTVKSRLHEARRQLAGDEDLALVKDGG